ncbi:hypothetical protein BDV27DRAFT_129069 [Aspergillus caelatus]|uniref:Uncharacterized protein n=1 Tax=Aspergillus caelatus TaxID=61420 RepID=A0A5N7A2F0_9EURO|nr:uncharacterized protein BDV27DRAFT_129069 [Aspergillus caelatus]KAE8364054.1 hypothetical protein BDV27DRAFT_129069 [Aspergillus caelatus]
MIQCQPSLPTPTKFSKMKNAWVCLDRSISSGKRSIVSPKVYVEDMCGGDCSTSDSGRQENERYPSRQR